MQQGDISRQDQDVTRKFFEALYCCRNGMSRPQRSFLDHLLEARLRGHIIGNWVGTPPIFSGRDHHGGDTGFECLGNGQRIGQKRLATEGMQDFGRFGEDSFALARRQNNDSNFHELSPFGTVRRL